MTERSSREENHLCKNRVFFSVSLSIVCDFTTCPEHQLHPDFIQSPQMFLDCLAFFPPFFLIFNLHPTVLILHIPLHVLFFFFSVALKMKHHILNKHREEYKHEGVKET